MASEGLHRYLLEQYVPQLDHAAATAISRRLEDATKQLRDRGIPIRWIRAVALPQDESLLCFIDAETIDEVLQAGERAGLSAAHIQEVTGLDRD
jgi:Protein of unknown function (DUF4242)